MGNLEILKNFLQKLAARIDLAGNDQIGRIEKNQAITKM